MNPLTVIFLILIILVILLIVLNRIATIEISWHTTIFGKKIGFTLKPFAFLKTWFIDPVTNLVVNCFTWINKQLQNITQILTSFGIPNELAGALAFSIIFVFSIVILWITYKIIGG